jgi:hypothetical protein
MDISTTARQLAPTGLRPEVELKCSVAVVYADTAARERGISLCHHLVREFWTEIDFEFSWWRFRYLADPDLADAAARAAAAADMVVLSARASEEMPGHVKDWFNLWLPAGQTRDAALIVLTDTRNEVELSRSAFVSFAEQAARRANLDCLLPWGAPRRVSGQDPLGMMRDRATHVSQVLDEILHHVGPPPTLPTHWGLNE